MSDPVYLTTRELADLLRIKERKIYEMAASGTVPHSKVTGKLLFPRAEIIAWLESHSTGPRPGESPSRRAVFLGSHDPMLDWALRESRCGLAALFDGSQNGLDSFAAQEGVATALHIHDAKTGEWNVPAVSGRFAYAPVVLVEWTRRQRGLVLQPRDAGRFSGFTDIAGQRVMMRQDGSGSQLLFRELAEKTGLSDRDFRAIGIAGTENEAALAVLEDKADVAFGLQSVAAQHRLAFVPVIEERFDLLIDRKAWFDQPLQQFMTYCRSEEFAARAGEQRGYDFSGMGTVHFNGA